MNTLQDFRYKRIYKAERGEHGSGNHRAGKDGESITLKIPTGTVVRDLKTDQILKDFQVDGEVWIAAKGGRGGKGNMHFVSSTFQGPKFAQPGEEGEEFELKFELKLLADVGLLGFPNAGKSSLIRRVSAARPKVADYPFTTLEPALGVVDLGDHASCVMVDIPGLIEGAHEGTGLGHRFLKHVERTRILAHLIDGAALIEAMAENADGNGAEAAGKLALERYLAIRKELELFNPELAHKPEILLINKHDVFTEEQIAAITPYLAKLPKPYTWTSTASGHGIQEFLNTLKENLSNIPFGLRTELQQKVILPHEVTASS